MLNLGGIGRLVYAALAAWCELEMFDGVGDVGLRTVQLDRCGDFREHLASGANKGLAAEILNIVGLFANDHQICAQGAFSPL